MLKKWITFISGEGRSNELNKKRLYRAGFFYSKKKSRVGKTQIGGFATMTCIPRIRLVKTRLTVCRNPLLPRTTSERENVEITVRAAQAIVTKSVVVIPIYSLSLFLLITNYL